MIGYRFKAPHKIVISTSPYNFNGARPLILNRREEARNASNWHVFNLCLLFYCSTFYGRNFDDGAASPHTRHVYPVGVSYPSIIFYSVWDS